MPSVLKNIVLSRCIVCIASALVIFEHYKGLYVIQINNKIILTLNFHEATLTGMRIIQNKICYAHILLIFIRYIPSK